MAKQTNFDWLVTCYDSDSNVLDSWIIEDRTEQEAEKEAIAAGIDNDDWSMVKLDDEVKRFVKAWGQSQKEVKELEDIHGNACAVSEMAINFGYVWVDKFKKWIKKNHMLYDQRDEVVLGYIREKYCG